MADSLQKLEASEEQKAQETPFNSSEPADVNEKRKKAGRKKKKDREVILALMQHPDGRQMIYDSTFLILHTNPVVAGDSLSTYYNLGMAKKARDLFVDVVKVAPDLFIKMMEECGGHD